MPKNDECKQIEHFEEENGLSFESPSEVPLNRIVKEQPIKFEYHVLYHLSYAVPYLCFNAYKSSKFSVRIVSNLLIFGFMNLRNEILFVFFEDGSLLSLDEAWKIFNDLNPTESEAIQQNMLKILTQMEHPILFRPFLTLHPCRIAEVLQSLPHSQNKVLSFLSIYGSTVYLTFDLKYAQFLNPTESIK